MIEYRVYQVDPNTKEEITTRSGVLTYENGNIIKEDQTAGTMKSTRTYSYDQKNNPFKDIQGFDLLLNEISLYGNNNSINTSVSSPQSLESANYLTTIIYNEKDYPLKYTSFTNGGKSVEYEIDFTYY